MARHLTAKEKRDKKKALAAKNLMHQQLFEFVRLHRLEDERVRSEERQRKRKSREGGGKEPLWSEKVSSIRNRLTGKQRDSKERWNRFAGTSGGGGRGL